MNGLSKVGGREVLPSGEGERRAQRGYVPQYDLAARLILQALASGRLKWIGVADRNAGAFDDIVLGLGDRISAYQVKTSSDPRPFSIKTVLLGAGDLLRRMIEARQKLEFQHPNTIIEIIYACDDYPKTDDNIARGKKTTSSAAFVRAHETYRLSWTLADWRASPFATFVEEVRTASSLDELEFEEAWRNTRFLAAGRQRSLGLREHNAAGDRRVQDIAALLPKLVADPINQDRWSVAEILSRLGWRDPFSARHSHTFPIHALYQSNAPTEEALQHALAAVKSGYVSLVGPPGVGKSTLLAAGLLPTPRAVVLRYLAFVPNEGQGLGRAEAVDFLQDLVTQMKQQNLGTDIIPGSELPELRRQFEVLMHAASERFRHEGTLTVIVVNGLDHVPARGEATTLLST